MRGDQTKFPRSGMRLSHKKRISYRFCWMQLLYPQRWMSFSGSTFAERWAANHRSIGSSDNDEKPSTPSKESAAPSKAARWLAGLAAGFAIAVALSLYILSVPQAPQSTPQPELPGPTPLPPLPPADAFDFVSSILLLLGVVLVVTAGLAWLSRRRSKHEAAIGKPSPHPGAIERQIASEVEAEILRRTAMRRDGGMSRVIRNP